MRDDALLEQKEADAEERFATCVTSLIWMFVLLGAFVFAAIIIALAM